MTPNWVKSIAMATAFLLPGLAVAQEADDPAAQAVPSPVFAQTMIVPAPTQEVTRQFFGQVTALDTAEISFEVGGALTYLDAQEGRTVEKGTLLAHLDLAPFERAVERADLALAQAQRDHDRLRTLATRNVASRSGADDAETARDLARIALRDAREALADAQIRAPFDGLVADRLGTAFTTIEPGQPILRLHNMSEIRVEFDLPERLLARVGDPRTVSFEGWLTGRDSPLPLEFREFRAETGRIGQSYTISLAAPQNGDAFLLPGRTVAVRARLPVDHGGVVLPVTAIATEPGGQQFVVAVTEAPEGLVAQHLPVEVRSDNGTDFTVTGVAPGTEIVAIGAHLIADGQPIKRFTGLTVEGI